MSVTGRGRSLLTSAWLAGIRARGEGRSLHPHGGSLSPLVKAVFPGDKDATEVTIFSDWFFGAPVGTNHYVLTAQGGSYAKVGQSATLLRSRRIIANSGAYSLVGQSAWIGRNRSLSASGGSYSYVGRQADLRRNRGLIAQSGSYSYVGRQAVLSHAMPTTLSQSAIDAIAAAVWARTLPLDASSVDVIYGTADLLPGDLNAISRSVWSRTL